MGSAASTRASPRRVPTTPPLDEWAVEIQHNNLDWRPATLVVDPKARSLRIDDEEAIAFRDIERAWTREGANADRTMTLEGKKLALVIRASAEAVEDVASALR